MEKIIKYKMVIKCNLYELLCWKYILLNFLYDKWLMEFFFNLYVYENVKGLLNLMFVCVGWNNLYLFYIFCFVLLFNEWLN